MIIACADIGLSQQIESRICDKYIYISVTGSRLLYPWIPGPIRLYNIFGAFLIFSSTVTSLDIADLLIDAHMCRLLNNWHRLSVSGQYKVFGVDWFPHSSRDIQNNIHD